MLLSNVQGLGSVFLICNEGYTILYISHNDFCPEKVELRK